MGRGGKGKPKTVGLGAGRGGLRQPTADVTRLTAEDDKCPSFSFRFADRSHDGAWSWFTAEESHEVMAFLCDIGASTWTELKNQMSGGHKKHHHQEFGSVCAEAQERLAALKHDERFEDLFRFRLGSTKRLWGFIVADVFYVLWWDRDHKVYPTEPKS